MTILDNSLVIPFFSRNGAGHVQRMAVEIGDLDIFLTSVTQLEVLQGARDEAEWRKIEAFMSTQEIIQPAPIVWPQVARAYFELRRAGLTVRSPLDCVIAEIAINRNMVRLHNDRDFEAIATVRPLVQRRIDLQTVPR